MISHAAPRHCIGTRRHCNIIAPTISIFKRPALLSWSKIFGVLRTHESSPVNWVASIIPKLQLFALRFWPSTKLHIAWQLSHFDSHFIRFALPGPDGVVWAGFGDQIETSRKHYEIWFWLYMSLHLRWIYKRKQKWIAKDSYLILKRITVSIVLQHLATPLRNTCIEAMHTYARVRCSRANQALRLVSGQCLVSLHHQYLNSYTKVSPPSKVKHGEQNSFRQLVLKSLVFLTDHMSTKFVSHRDMRVLFM